jgi:hypothetical protein
MTDLAVPPASSSGSTPRLRRRVFAAVALLLALAGGEAAWRAFVPQSSAERDSAEYIKTARRYLSPCAAVEKRGDVPTVVGRLLQNTGGAFEFPLAKTRGVTRIAFVGESSGVMFGNAAFNAIADAGADARWQLMNCAESGTTVEHVERRADEALGYAPDVLVVVFGHNWLMPPMPMNDAALRAEEVLSRSRLVTGIAHRLMTYSVPQPPAPRDPPGRLACLEDFLRHVARAGREHETTVVLTTMTSNLAFPPLVEEDALGDPDFVAAALDDAGGRPLAAIARLEKLAKTRPHPYWEFVLAMWLARAGEGERAAEHFQAAVDGEQVEPDRATSAVNDLIRRVAAEEDAVLRDTDREIRRIAAGGVPGWDVMRDHCHLQPRYAGDEARALLDLAAAAVPVARALPRRESPSEGDDVARWMLDGLSSVQAQLRDARARRYQRALSYFVEHWTRKQAERTLADVADFLGGTVFVGLSPKDKAAVLVAIADGFEWAGLGEQALTTNALARAALGLTDAAAGDVPARPAPAAAAPSGAPLPLTSPYEHVAEENAWIQLGMFRLTAREPHAAADAFRRALAVTSRKDARLLLDAAMREPGE